MDILYYHGASCHCCTEMRPKVNDFAKKYGLQITEVDIRDFEDPNRFLIENIDGVPITALRENGKILAIIEGNRFDDDCFDVFLEKM